MKGQVAEGFKGRASSASARFGGRRLQSGPLVRTIRSVVRTIRPVVRTIRPVVRTIRPVVRGGVGWGGVVWHTVGGGGGVWCGVGVVVVAWGVGWGWGGVGGECTHGRLQVSPFQHLMFAFNLPFLHLFFTYYSTFFSPFALPPVPNKNYLGGY